MAKDKPKGTITNVVEEQAKPPVTLTTMDPKSFKEALERWDVDNDPAVAPKTISSAELYEGTKIPRTLPGRKTETKISGYLVTESGNKEIKDDRGKVVRNVKLQLGQRFRGWNNLREVYRSVGRQKRLRESYGVELDRIGGNLLRRWAEARRNKKMLEGFSDDPFAAGFEPGDAVTGATASPNDEFIPIQLGPYNRNLYWQDFNDQASKAFEAYNHNPVAKAVAQLFQHFVIGTGIKVTCANPLVQQAWDEYVRLTDWHNQMRRLQNELCVIGEGWIYDPFAEAPGMELWDATTVWEIVTNPRKISDVYYAHRQFPTQYQLLQGSEKMPEGQRPIAQEYVVEQVGPQDWLQIKANATVGEKRGRSDFYPVLTWFKRFKDWFNAAVINGQISNAFVVWWKVTGADSDVQSLRGNADFTTLPPPGSAWFTNDQVVPTLLQAKGGLTASDRTGAQILSIIAASVNLPAEFLGVDSSVPRASSITKSQPGWKTFEARQQLMKEVVSWQVERLVFKLQRAGVLPWRQPKAATIRKLNMLAYAKDFDGCRREIDNLRSGGMYEQELDAAFEVSMASPQPEDRGSKIKDLGAGLVSGAISHETYSNNYYKVMDLNRIDYHAEQDKRRHEAEMGIISPSMPADEGGGAPVDGEMEGPDAPDGMGGDEPPREGSPDDDKQYRQDNQEQPRE